MILIVDDNDIIVDMLVLQIEAMGYTSDVARDGEMAVKKVSAGSYQLVIMDIVLTKMNGIDAARAIRALPPPKGSTPIIALTGGMAQSTLAEISAAEFDLIVQKPVLPDELKAIIERYARAA